MADKGKKKNKRSTKQQGLLERAVANIQLGGGARNPLEAVRADLISQYGAPAYGRPFDPRDVGPTSPEGAASYGRPYDPRHPGPSLDRPRTATGSQPTGPFGPSVDPLEEYIATLGAVDTGAYTRPYDEAADAARQSHAQGVPVIEGAYGQLGTSLASGQADLQSRIATYQQALQQRAAQAQTQQQQMGTEALSRLQGLGGGGSLTAGLEAGAAGRAGGAAALGTTGGDHLARLAQVYNESSAARQQDVGAAKAAALSNAQNNLGALLGQIGLRRADAQRQAGNDASSQRGQIARLRLDQQQGEQASREKAIEQFIKLTEKAGVAPRDTLQLLGPRATGAAEVVIEAIGKQATPLNRQLAARAVTAKAADWQKEGLDPRAIGAWLDKFYNDEKVLDQNLLARLARANPSLSDLLARGGAS